MPSFISGIPKDIRDAINWFKGCHKNCSACGKDMKDFKFLWVPPHLNILCGCPHYHFALCMECPFCGRTKEVGIDAVSNSNNVMSYCPECLV